jgi:transposase
MPPAKILLVDKGYHADWFREVREDKGISASNDRSLKKQRQRIENLFALLKELRRIAIRYDICGEVLLSAICIPHDAELYHQRHKMENMSACLKGWRSI